MPCAFRKMMIIVMLSFLSEVSFAAPAIASMKDYLTNGQGFGIVVRLFGRHARDLHSILASEFKPADGGLVFGRDQVFACRPDQCYIFIKSYNFMIKDDSDEGSHTAEFMSYIPLQGRAMELNLLWEQRNEHPQIQLNTLIRIHREAGQIVSQSLKHPAACTEVISDVIPINTECSYQLVKGTQGLLLNGGDFSYPLTIFSYPKTQRLLLSLMGSEAEKIHGWVEGLQANNPEIQKSFSPEWNRVFYRDEVSCFQPTAGSVEKTYAYRCHIILDRGATGSLVSSIPPSLLTFRPHFTQKILDGGRLTLGPLPNPIAVELASCRHWNEVDQNKMYPCIYKETGDFSIDEYVPYPSFHPQGVAVGWGVQQESDD